ncbi:hypothetical protein ACOSQ3_021265 [Xanthoceras sorbifolium]
MTGSGHLKHPKEALGPISIPKRNFPSHNLPQDVIRTKRSWLRNTAILRLCPIVYGSEKKELVEKLYLLRHFN